MVKKINALVTGPLSLPLRAVVAIGVSWLLVAASIQLALSVPKSETLSGFGNSGSLDYSATSGSFAPLDPQFIAELLGYSPGTVVGAEGQGAVNGSSRRLTGSSGRTVVHHEATNDNFANAYPVPRVPFTATTNSIGATRETSEPSGCSPVGGTVWYRYRPSTSAGLIATTIGSGHAISLGIYEGTSFSNLKSIGCDTDVTGLTWVGFSAQKGRSYYFQVASPTGGALVFTLQSVGSAERVSVSSDGQEGNRSSGRSEGPAISSDGRYIAFESLADNLVPGDTNGFADVFVHDRKTKLTKRVSVSSAGEEALGRSDYSGPPAISGDGRYVAFFSWAPNLVSGDTNGYEDVFVHDRKTKTTKRVSVTSQGAEGRAPTDPLFLADDSSCAAAGDAPNDIRCVIYKGLTISADGRHIAFEHVLQGLTPNDQNNEGVEDIFVHDQKTGITELVSVNSSGQQGNGHHEDPVITPDGRFVAFEAYDSRNLTPNTPPDIESVYLHDRVSGKTTLVSVSSSGVPGNDFSGNPAISADGRYIAFGSDATNLSTLDTNGDYDDLYVHDRRTGRTVLASVSSASKAQQPPITGEEAVMFPSMSADGRYVTFSSWAANLVAGDTNGLPDVFIRDLRLGTTTRISNSPTGPQANESSRFAVLSSLGNVVAFWSFASNLVADDRNETGDVFVLDLNFLR